LQIARNAASVEGIAACLGNLAKLALDQWLSTEAERLALEALPSAMQLGPQDLIAEDCYCYARALDQQNLLKQSEALAYCRRTVDILRKLRLPRSPPTLRPCSANVKTKQADRHPLKSLKRNRHSRTSLPEGRYPHLSE
jgi:hypothetical protein